ncbi:MAG: FliA/WhiG family RNA polymerase sigma factor [Nitrospiraceae bacterium]
MKSPSGSSVAQGQTTLGVGSADTERERLIREFAPLVRTMAHRLAFRLPAYLDVEDLVSVGVIGLMDAMTKYDSRREANFKTYAEFRIRGAMLDEIRSLDWVPRSVHERIGLLQRTEGSLMRRLGRPPTDEELAHGLGLSVQELGDFIANAQGAIVMSLDDLGVQDSDGEKIIRMLVDTQHPDPLSLVVTQRLRSALEEAIEGLPEKERMVLTLYYVEELTMKEIGSVLNITESRVCQIHAKTIVRLKALLQMLEG